MLIVKEIDYFPLLPTKEYFENDDKEEVAICLDDFNIQNIKHEVSMLIQPQRWPGFESASLVIDAMNIVKCLLVCGSVG